MENSWGDFSVHGIFRRWRATVARLLCDRRFSPQVHCGCFGPSPRRAFLWDAGGMPRLLQDLDATFLRMVETNAWRHQFELAGADGVMFLCPKCWTSNGNSKVGTHSVICWFVGRVPDDLSPKPGRWTPSGTGLTDLTFVPGDPPKAISVHLTGGGCGWHGFVKNGNAE